MSLYELLYVKEDINKESCFLLLVCNSSILVFLDVLVRYINLCPTVSDKVLCHFLLLLLF